jgi:hypothetical protein
LTTVKITYLASYIIFSLEKCELCPQRPNPNPANAAWPAWSMVAKVHRLQLDLAEVCGRFAGSFKGATLAQIIGHRQPFRRNVYPIADVKPTTG